MGDVGKVINIVLWGGGHYHGIQINFGGVLLAKCQEQSMDVFKFNLYSIKICI